jgi:hypothetical protein
MIPLKDTVAIVPAGLKDKWGINTEGVPYELPSKISFNLKHKDDSFVPDGSLLLKGKQNLDMTAKFRFTAFDGKTYEVIPTEIKPIKDTNGKILFTKVFF